MAGFREIAASLWTPTLGILRANWPIVSGGYSENSRFQETSAGDGVRPALRDGSAVQSLNISPS
jgi:hypothetical protein